MFFDFLLTVHSRHYLRGLGCTFADCTLKTLPGGFRLYTGSVYTPTRYTGAVLALLEGVRMYTPRDRGHLMHHVPQDSWGQTYRVTCLTLPLYIIYRQNQGGIFSFF